MSDSTGPKAASLVQPEGTNAASADETDEDADRGGRGDGVTGSAPGTTTGGRPQDAPDPAQALTGYGAAADDDELAGAPSDGPGDPSQEHGSSGQDAGSMD